jgi:hypothetical protein
MRLYSCKTCRVATFVINTKAKVAITFNAKFWAAVTQTLHKCDCDQDEQVLTIICIECSCDKVDSHVRKLAHLCASFDNSCVYHNYLHICSCDCGKVFYVARTYMQCFVKTCSSCSHKPKSYPAFYAKFGPLPKPANIISTGLRLRTLHICSCDKFRSVCRKNIYAKFKFWLLRHKSCEF